MPVEWGLVSSGTVLLLMRYSFVWAHSGSSEPSSGVPKMVADGVDVSFVSKLSPKSSSTFSRSPSSSSAFSRSPSSSSAFSRSPSCSSSFSRSPSGSSSFSRSPSSSSAFSRLSSSASSFSRLSSNASAFSMFPSLLPVAVAMLAGISITTITRHKRNASILLIRFAINDYPP